MEKQRVLDLKRMRFIVEVARAESISLAADLLNISQPALTRNIADVEKDLGVQLFHRLPRGVRLTDEGKLFVARAKQILGDVENMAAEIRDASPTAGRLRIGIVPSGYIGHIRPLLGELANEFPEGSVEIVSGSAQEICPRLLHGELHVIVGANSYLQKWRDVNIVRLKKMTLACIVRRDHPLAGQKTISEIDILAWPAVLPASVDVLHSDLSQRYAARGLPPFQPRYVVDDFEAQRLFIERSNAFLPIMTTPEHIRSLAQQYHVIRDVLKIEPHHVSLATASYRPSSRMADWFQHRLGEVLTRASTAAT